MDSGTPLEIITREAWDPNCMLPDVVDLRPARCLIFGTTETFQERLKYNCPSFWKNDTHSCIEKIVYLTNIDISKHGEMRYNFLIGADGKVYEGLGWGNAPGLARRYTDMALTCLHIGYLDPMPGNKPSAEMLEARYKLIEYGVKNNLIRPKIMEMYQRQRMFWNAFTRFLGRQ